MTKLVFDLIVLELGFTLISFGCTLRFFIEKYEYDRLRRDFNLYWPEIGRKALKKGLTLWSFLNIIVFIFLVYNIR